MHKADHIVFVIGRFQAFHRGHQYLIEQAKALFPTYRVGIITFSPDPRDFFAGSIQQKILTHAERLKKFEASGVDEVIEFTFDDAFSKLTKKAFLQLMKSFQIEHIVHGGDFRFGSVDDHHQVDASILHEIPDLEVANQKISSSELVIVLQSGEIEELNRLLGYTYEVTGNVIQGKQLARQIGFPTANLFIDSEKLLPENGVYATKTSIDDKIYTSITHIGPSPTFDRKEKVVETHIIDRDLLLYGKDITVLFYKKIRGIQTFSGIDAVKQQLIEDVEVVKSFFTSDRTDI